MRGQNHGVLVFGVAVRKGLLSQSAFAAIDSNPKHIYAVSLSPGEMPSCPPTCKIVVVKSMLPSFSQLLVSKYLLTNGFNFIANCPRPMEFLGQSSNLSSLGCSATADIASRPDLPL